MFSLTLHENSLSTLEIIKKYFLYKGFIIKNKKKFCVEYRVSNILELEQIILPHFLKYPMCGRKQQVVYNFTNILFMLKNKQHKDANKFLNIIEQIFIFLFLETFQIKTFVTYCSFERIIKFFFT